MRPATRVVGFNMKSCSYNLKHEDILWLQRHITWYMVPFVHTNGYGTMNIHIIFCIYDMFSKFHVADHWSSLVFPTAWYLLMHQIPWKSARIPPWYFTNYQCEFQPGSRIHSNAPCHTTTEDDLGQALCWTASHADSEDGWTCRAGL